MPKKVLNHFKKHDRRLYDALENYRVVRYGGPTHKDNLFMGLCRIIVGQQLSGKAARAIWEKFIALFPNNTPTPRALLKHSDATLRSSGISFAKIRALRDLSEHIEQGLDLEALRDARIADVEAALLPVRGIGPWSIEMFLMFSLGHEDVFSAGDLGLRKGIQKIYKLKQLPEKDYIEQVSQKWSPYRTYAAVALWGILDN